MRSRGILFAALAAVLAAACGCPPSMPTPPPPPPARRGLVEAFSHPLGLEFVVVPAAGPVSAKFVGLEVTNNPRVPYLMSAHEITNKQYEAFVAAYKKEMAARDPKAEVDEATRELDERILAHERHPKSPGDNHPVNNVTAEEAAAFCRWLGRTDGDGRTYRLPRTDEWDYAARAGKSYRRYPWGNEIDPKKACYNADGPEPVGSYPPNAFGLYDVVGNVAEWNIHDGFPPHTLRGGSWRDGPVRLQLTRVGRRPSRQPALDHHGFRVYCEPSGLAVATRE